MQQLMSVLIGRHDVLFPRDEDSPKTLELVNNNNEVGGVRARGYEPKHGIKSLVLAS